MKFSTIALTATFALANLNMALGQGVWLDHKPDSDGVRDRERHLRQLQAELASEVSFGAACPSLPAGRDPGDRSDPDGDEGWTPVPFGYNDDDSARIADIGFDFEMYGETRRFIFINNNGNLSFQPYSTFTPQGFPVGGFKMVAPFWGDVDTRGGNIGNVWMRRLGGTAFAVAWDHVGFYFKNGSKRNTFQVIISDGTYDPMGQGNNVCFCYDEMEWTTGNASGGRNGFGGSSATVGVNNGDGILHSTFDRYNSARISELNGQNFCFSVQSNSNINPIPQGVPDGGVVFLECGEALNLEISFASPESNQFTTISVPATPPFAMDIDIVNGNTATATIGWIAPSTARVQYLTLLAEDNIGGSTAVEVALVSQGATCHNGGSGGDPHFKTWLGEFYDFHGICDLVLLDAPGFSDGLGLSIQVRTKPRYNYSFIESAAVKIGDTVLEVSSWGQYMLDGISNAEFPLSLGEFPITYETRNDKSGAFHIELHNGEEIVVAFLKDMVSVSVHNATEVNFGSSVGLMGDYKSGSKLARDGTTVFSDPDAFGKEWQVLPTEQELFQTPSPVVGQTCLPPNISEKRRLGEATVSQEAAAKACAHYKDASMEERCVFDVMAMDDLEVAAGAF